jgi:hypothetical protein
MLEDFCCEVIGCEERACWLLVLCQDNYSEEFLCNAHWELLNHHDPQRASHYTHLSSVLAEGMGLMEALPPKPDAGQQLSAASGAANHSGTQTVEKQGVERVPVKPHR